MTPREQPRTQPQTFGDELRRLRESAGLDIDDIMAETKVARRILEALEEGKFEYLPERVFSRNFVRQYAQTIGADVDRLAQAFDAAWERFLLASGSHPVVLFDAPPPRLPIRWNFWVPVILAVVIVIAVLVITVRGSRGAAPFALDVARTAEPTPTAAWRPTVAPVPPVPPAEATESPPDESVAFVVTADKSGECWLHYRDRDGRTGERLLRGGERTSFDLVGPVLLTIGNAAVVTLRIGGDELSGLGEAGEVVDLEVSRDGVRRLGAGAGRG